MSRETMFERYDNGKIKKPYITIDLSIFDGMEHSIKDPVKKWNVIAAFREYERTGGEFIPDLDTDIEQAFLFMFIDKHELCRSAWQDKSAKRKEASEAAAAARNKVPKPSKRLP